MAMSMTSDSVHNDLFSSLISDIKYYTGKDPLLPWLRGIKKMKETLASSVLKEKLPRFLQKCAETFEYDSRYRNDVRYLRVWLQLMDCVDEPRTLLRKMEMNSIGKKRSLFYQAYALYYEKMKKFEEAEKMYHLGVQNLAEPIDELQKSYDQFLCRLERQNNKKMQHQERRPSRRPLSSIKAKERKENACNTNDRSQEKLDKSSQNVKLANPSKDGMGDMTSMKKNHVQMGRAKDKESDKSRMFHGEDTVVVVKFVDTAIVGKSEAEDACHHGLVDPTINMKEAMNAINSMFREPIEAAPISRRSKSSQQKKYNLENGFNVFVDEDLDNQTESSHQKEEPLQIFIDSEENGEAMNAINSMFREPIETAPISRRSKRSLQKQHSLENGFNVFVDEDLANLTESSHRKEPLQIFIDNEENGKNGDTNDENAENAFVFPCPKDLQFENSDDINAENSPHVKLREDTVVHRFVGSTISDEPAVENVCHHGLVDPTINLKEAMEDINNMFGKPIDFVRSKRPKNQEKAPVLNQDPRGFSILPDDDFEDKKTQPPIRSTRVRDSDLFEPTLFTKEAMDDINKMFAVPLDF